MSKTYSDSDRKRTATIMDMAMEHMAPRDGVNAGPWMDLSFLTEAIGLRLDQVGTVKSKLRELNDKWHVDQPFRLETRTNPDGPRGAWLYRVVRVKSGQLDLPIGLGPSDTQPTPLA